MKSRTEYWVEWVDRAEMDRDYPEAARKGGFSEADIRKSEGYLDCCPPEHYTRGRRFPSIATAKAWARKNSALDVWGSPRAIVRLVTPATYELPEDFEDVEVWSLECGTFERIDA